MNIIYRVGRWKMFIQRSVGYISIVNMVMIIFMFLSSLENYGVDVNLKLWFLPIIITILVILVFLGWLEDKLGIFKSEAYSTVQRNPYITEMLAILRKMDGRNIEVVGDTEYIKKLEKDKTDLGHLEDES